MINGPVNPAFQAYAVTAVVLSLNLLFLWSYSGVVRGRTKTAMNTEDSARFNVPLTAGDPPEVARVLRAYNNAEASIYPFLLLGLVFVLAGGSAQAAILIFSVFTLARLFHSWVYLAGKQPWRTLTFVLGQLTTLVLIGEVIWLVIQGPPV